ncbi:MAG TPA: head maturation protease, ClpP-related, partial [Mobilitalea sp.]|nr:head maturation protease, ClpP-related [Mobilitalea sp.]
GEVPEGWAIYNALKRHKAKIRTIDDGFAASIASVIFMAGDERIMSNLSLLFVHNAWTYATGNASDMRKAADDLETMSQMSAKAYADCVNITEDELNALLDAESYITPQDALTMGFATSIVSDSTSKNPSQSVKKMIMEQLLKPVETLKEPPKPKEEIPPIEEPPKENKLKQMLLRATQQKEGK